MTGSRTSEHKACQIQALDSCRSRPMSPLISPLPCMLPAMSRPTICSLLSCFCQLLLRVNTPYLLLVSAYAVWLHLWVSCTGRGRLTPSFSGALFLQGIPPYLLARATFIAEQGATFTNAVGSLQEDAQPEMRQDPFPCYWPCSHTATHPTTFKNSHV